MSCNVGSLTWLIAFAFEVQDMDKPGCNISFLHQLEKHGKNGENNVKSPMLACESCGMFEAKTRSRPLEQTTHRLVPPRGRKGPCLSAGADCGREYVARENRDD